MQYIPEIKLIEYFNNSATILNGIKTVIKTRALLLIVINGLVKTLDIVNHI